MDWSDTFVQTLKNNDVRYVTYVLAARLKRR